MWQPPVCEPELWRCNLREVSGSSSGDSSQRISQAKQCQPLGWFGSRWHLPGGLLSRTASHTLIFRMKARSNCSTWDSRDSELWRRQQLLLACSWGGSQGISQGWVLDAMPKQEWKPHLMERRGGCVISKTNLSTGWCSLSRITTTTFSTSFCRNQDRKIPSFIRAVCCPECASHTLTQWECTQLLGLTAQALIQNLSSDYS